MRYTGKGRYFHDHRWGWGDFFFERGEDAAMFALVWL
jgi:hypothetical protein